MVRLGSIRQIHALFTDAAPPAALAGQLREAGVALHVAGPDERNQVA